MERKKKYVTFQIFCKYIIQNICEIITLQHEVPESQKCYVGQPQLPCTYLPRSSILNSTQADPNKLFILRIIFENFSFDKISNISRKERLLSKT